jgi:hypothetical protein
MKEDTTRDVPVDIDIDAELLKKIEAPSGLLAFLLKKTKSIRVTARTTEGGLLVNKMRVYDFILSLIPEKFQNIRNRLEALRNKKSFRFVINIPIEKTHDAITSLG